MLAKSWPVCGFLMHFYRVKLKTSAVCQHLGYELQSLPKNCLLEVLPCTSAGPVHCAWRRNSWEDKSSKMAWLVTHTPHPPPIYPFRWTPLPSIPSTARWPLWARTDASASGTKTPAPSWRPRSSWTSQSRPVASTTTATSSRTLPVTTGQR